MSALKATSAGPKLCLPIITRRVRSVKVSAAAGLLSAATDRATSSLAFGGGRGFASFSSSSSTAIAFWESPAELLAPRLPSLLGIDLPSSSFRHASATAGFLFDAAD